MCYCMLFVMLLMITVKIKPLHTNRMHNNTSEKKKKKLDFAVKLIVIVVNIIFVTQNINYNNCIYHFNSFLLNFSYVFHI